MTQIDKALAKLVKESGVSQERIVSLLMAEQAREAGLPYCQVVEHEKYGLHLEIYSGKKNGHRPFSLSVNKAISVKHLLESIDQFIEENTTPEARARTILRKAK